MLIERVDVKDGRGRFDVAVEDHAAAERLQSCLVDALRARHEAEKLRERAETAEGYLARRGYVPCDIPACNCGLWHGGNSEARLAEIRDALTEAGIEMNGKTLLDGVKEALVNQSETVR